MTGIIQHANPLIAVLVKLSLLYNIGKLEEFFSNIEKSSSSFFIVAFSSLLYVFKYKFNILIPFALYSYNFINFCILLLEYALGSYEKYFATL